MDRFWSKVQRGDASECWPWLASADKDGYGWFGFRGRADKAHRVSWLFANGEIPKGAWVLHRCDNPPCVNPDHLFLGDNVLNSADRTTKGRGRRGQTMPAASMTNEAARVIRTLFACGARQSSLARVFGTSKHAVWQLVHGVSWMHVV